MPAPMPSSKMSRLFRRLMARLHEFLWTNDRALERARARSNEREGHNFRIQTRGGGRGGLSAAARTPAARSGSINAKGNGDICDVASTMATVAVAHLSA